MIGSQVRGWVVRAGISVMIRREEMDVSFVGNGLEDGCVCMQKKFTGGCCYGGRLLQCTTFFAAKAVVDSFFGLVGDAAC